MGLEQGGGRRGYSWAVGRQAEGRPRVGQKEVSRGGLGEDLQLYLKPVSV